MPPGFTDLRVDPGTALVFHPVGDRGANWTVENVVAPVAVYDPKRVRVAGHRRRLSARRRRSAPLRWWLNGRVLQTKMVDVPRNGRAQVEFLGLDAPYGFSRGEVRIDCGDSLAGDDRFTFSVERPIRARFCLWTTAAIRAAQVYFREALDSSGDGAFQVECAARRSGPPRDTLRLCLRGAVRSWERSRGGLTSSLKLRHRAEDRC